MVFCCELRVWITGTMYRTEIWCPIVSFGRWNNVMNLNMMVFGNIPWVPEQYDGVR